MEAFISISYGEPLTANFKQWFGFLKILEERKGYSCVKEQIFSEHDEVATSL